MAVLGLLACPRCRQIWGRDCNAALNLTLKASLILNQIELPACWRKGGGGVQAAAGDGDDSDGDGEGGDNQGDGDGDGDEDGERGDPEQQQQ